MKLLLVNPNVTMGGAQKIVLSLAYHLQRLGHEVTIFTTHVERDDLPEPFRRLEIIRSRHRILRPGGTTTRFQNVPVPQLALRLLRMRRELRALLQHRRFDAVLAHQPPAPWLCSFLPVPVIWNCFEPIALWRSSRPEYFSLRPERSGALAAAAERIYEALDRLIVRRGIPHLFVLSERLRRQVVSLYGKPAEVFYPGSDCSVDGLDGESGAHSAGGPERSGDQFTILQVGQFNYEKNHLVTVEAVQRLKADGLPTPLRLQFVGEGGLESRIAERVRACGLEGEASFLGAFPIHDPRLRRVYRQADVVVFPSIMQSWGLVPFEALAHGVVPIVSSDCGAAEVIQERAIGYVAEPTAADVHRALRYVHDHPEEARQRAERGRQFVTRELTYARYAEQIAKRLEEIIA
jgi:glycosyltransferase involved in cell wall biosynthesis